MTDQQQFNVTWIDEGREPKNPPNPDYPNGIDLDLSQGKPSCTVILPYPAKRIGKYVVHCHKCGQRSMITTAGRTDDPRSARFACPLKVQ